MTDSTANQDIIKQDSETRFEFFLDQVLENEQVWILHDEQGFVLFSHEEVESIPVWDSEVHAKHWATDEWAECNVRAIPLEEWLDRWTKGLAKDNIHVAVLPNHEGESLVVSAEDLADELDGEEE